MRLVEQNDVSPYVVISHTGVDGLGSLTNNQIPNASSERINEESSTLGLECRLLARHTLLSIRLYEQAQRAG